MESDRKNLVEFFVFFFISLQIFSSLYLYFFWLAFGKSAFDYVELQNVIFSAGGFALSFSAFSLVFVVVFQDFKLNFEPKLKTVLCFMFFFAVLNFLPFYLVGKSKDFLSLSYVLVCLIIIPSHFLAGYVQALNEDSAFFVKREMTYSYVFVVLVGMSFCMNFASLNARNVGFSNLQDVKNIMSIKGDESCLYRVIGSLGSFWFVVPDLKGQGTSVYDQGVVHSVPFVNVDKITSFRGSSDSSVGLSNCSGS
ncbi:hypothetical protein [Vreelandella titanicae]|uniref:Uncharacterized protein n=1 Tax=Vreelandella titanicae TaxID=664683 RepID=A0AAP9NR68_9GAMM|nr:hypothetical protein [Halomonas titanicae]QKS26559.1 hypothetical protein FX987_04368 [Halomonas titanicae]